MISLSRDYELEKLKCDKLMEVNYFNYKFQIKNSKDV